MRMDFSAFLALCGPLAFFAAPVTILLLLCWQALLSLQARTGRKLSQSEKARIIATSSAGIGGTLQFLSALYHPSDARMIAAQIEQHEDPDDDDHGTPETPLKHLHRQLRRIRRGEHVDHLTWRLR
jgi:hypothetical protein